MSKLTIGMCVYDDYDGLFFTIQSIRMYHKEVLDDIEFVVINNNPNSTAGDLIREFMFSQVTVPFKYLDFERYTGTAIRDKIFQMSDTPYVLVVDSHVMIEPGAIKKLIDFYDEEKDEGNLLHGPLINDSFKTVSTHFTREWESFMYGKWDTNNFNYKDSDSEPFEIEAQGLGLFSCRKDYWVGFNPDFRGFGGEEIYIHDKFRLNGKKVICLPFLGWVHRFGRVSVPYPNTVEDRYRNYLLGRIELDQDFDDVEAAFADVLTEEVKETVRLNLINLLSTPKTQGGCNCKGGSPDMVVSAIRESKDNKSTTDAPS